jgi:hypothetical protein
MSAPFEEGGRERVLARALALAGLSDAPAQWSALLDSAADAALALCCRDDIPAAMEGGVAALLCELFRDGADRPVTSVRRGDTAITYGSLGLQDARLLLQPFVRLHTI